MNPAAATALGWISYLGAAVAVIVYFAVLLRRPQAVRLMNGSGLFFSGVALTQVPALLNRPDVFGGAAFPLAVLVVMLLLAVVAQAAAALRNRNAWDGVDRRTLSEPSTAGDKGARSGDRRGEDRRSGQPDPSFDVADRREADRREASERRGASPPGQAAGGPRGPDRRSGEPDPYFDVADRRQGDRRGADPGGDGD